MRAESLIAETMRWLSRSYRIKNRLYRRGVGRLNATRRTEFYTAAWEEAATDFGASVVHLDGALSVETASGESLIRVRNNVTSLDDPVTLSLASDKPLVYRLLKERGVPIPRHCVCKFNDLTTARRFAASLGGACVVKPARGTGAGTGVTTGISSTSRLVAAMARAGSHGEDLVIEEQIEGDNYRLLYLDGELLDAVRRLPPTVCGDGKSTVKELIARENQERADEGIEASQRPMRIDWELRLTLRDAGYRLDSVPSEGEIVRIKRVVSDNRGEDNVPATESLCSAVVEAGAIAAAAVGARLAGIDVITPDASLPLAEAGGVIVEVNTTPGLYYHKKRDGVSVPAAVQILQRLSTSE